MLLAIQCIVLCGLFTLIILPSLYKNPIGQIMSYPPKIRKRVESLPQYANTIQATKQKHLAAKIASVFIIAAVLALVAYLSGAQTFWSAFLHVFILFFSVNLYDMLVLDIGIFCHSKKLMIPGTEDMTAEYKSPLHHIWGAGVGTLLGVGVGLLSGGFVSLYVLLAG
ncbi:MAG: hypothetical protein ACK5JF_06950 [Oscillospiraceae bacterium]